jgi:hypothetical protein
MQKTTASLRYYPERRLSRRKSQSPSGERAASADRSHPRKGRQTAVLALRGACLGAGTGRPKPRRVCDFVRERPWLLRIVASMIAPCSVKTYGAYLRCWPRPVFKVANCDLKELVSSAVSWNMKSAGKRLRLRRTCSLKRLVLTHRGRRVRNPAARAGRAG